MDPVGLSIADTARFLGLGRTRVYELLAAGQLCGRKCGRRVLIEADSARRFLSRLPTVRILPPARPRRRAAAAAPNGDQ